MDRMIERVARAIQDEGPVGCCVISDEHAETLARAAVEAMREPGVGIMTEEDAAGAFARWIEQGPKLAKAAGCHVGIRVTEGAR